MPATMPYGGASRCLPIGAPARACSGGAAAASYDRPKNATHRRATTPRISKVENSTRPVGRLHPDNQVPKISASVSGARPFN